jgi:hypothetical protein
VVRWEGGEAQPRVRAGVRACAHGCRRGGGAAGRRGGGVQRGAECRGLVAVERAVKRLTIEKLLGRLVGVRG